jgi:hypothetical protein
VRPYLKEREAGREERGRKEEILYIMLKCLKNNIFKRKIKVF